MPALELDINLFKESGIVTRPLGKFLRWSLTYGRYIIIGTQIIVLLAFFSRFRFDQELSDLHTRIDEKTNIVEALSPIETATRAIQNRLEIIEKLESSRSLYFLVLTTLSQETPKDIYVEKISFNQNQLSISGKSRTNKAFDNFLTFIRKNGSFSQISLEEINVGSDNLISFKLSMQVQQKEAYTN